MKAVVALAVFACVAAVVSASGYYEPGFRRTYNGISAPYNNAERQEAVNYRAEHIGRSSGTARWDGVPGTGLNFGYRGYGYGDGYGRGNHYSYNGYGSNPYFGYAPYAPVAPAPAAQAPAAEAPQADAAK